MSKELTDEQKKQLQEIQAHRKEKVEGLAYKALALSLRDNLPVMDLPYYVLQRTRLIIEEAFKTVDFKNPELQKARFDFLKVCLKEMKKNVVVAPVKEVKDETDARDNRCEPVCQELVKMILDEDLVFSDENYFNLILEDEEKVPLSAAIAGYEGALDEKMTMIISEHFSRAQKELWGVEKEDITFEMLDTVLKRNIETPKK
jgi:hypothetical protein